MTDTSTGTPAAGRGIALSALIAGLVSLAAVVLFFASELGAAAMWTGVVVGVIAAVLGIVALRKRQPKGPAITGLVIGALCALLGIAIFIFALAFLGVFMSESPVN